MHGSQPSSSARCALHSTTRSPPPNGAGGSRRVLHQLNDDDELLQTIRDGGVKRHSDPLKAELWVVREMLTRGFVAASIIKVLLDPDNRISDHAYGQPDPQ